VSNSRSLSAFAFVACVACVACASCAGTSAELTAAKSTAYQGSFDDVWNKVVASINHEFPMVQELDQQHHRILTCWHTIDRHLDTVSAGDINADRFFYRAAIQISDAPPWRIVVSGRAAHFTQPSVFPFKHDDPSEPAWVDGRTEKIAVAIHEGLKASAAPATGAPPPAYDPGDVENIADTCIVGDIVGIPVQHTKGIKIGTETQ